MLSSKQIPGIILCLIMAIPAWILGQYLPLIGAPVFAILLGMLVGRLVQVRDKVALGVAFTSKIILQAAVVLLGFGLNLNQIMSVGIQSLPVIISTIATALLVAYLLQKVLDMDGATAVLVGVGSSICGGSAIAATAPIIKAKDEEVAKAISVIFLFNILAALIFPTLGQVLGLSNEGFALFAGTAVNDTSSVTATASAWDAVHHSHSLDGATIVKLTRTLAIIPITMGLSAYQASKTSQDTRQSFSLKRAFPMFLLYFLGASILATLIQGAGFHSALLAQVKHLSKFLIVMAMAAIGFNTDLVKLIRTGGPAMVLGATCWVAITCVSLLMQSLLGMW